MKGLGSKGRFYWVIAAFFLLFKTAVAASFSYLYIEASEGNSSGGHAAIQFGDDVYHYQHLDSGLIRLFKQDKTEFHFLYRFLQNRPMHESRVDVSGDTLDLLHDRFRDEFVKQERLFRLQLDARRERIFLNALLHAPSPESVGTIDSEASNVLRLKGVGLFYPAQGPKKQEIHEPDLNQKAVITRLKQTIEQQLGPDFFTRRLDAIEKNLAGLAPVSWPKPPFEFNGGTPTLSVYSSSDRFLDELTAWFALRAIADRMPLQKGAYWQPDSPEFRLAEDEKKALADVRQSLASSLLKSLTSSRPDWGYAALVNLARYLAVDVSLQTGHWRILDDHDEEGQSIGADAYAEHRPELRRLIDDSRAAVQRSRRELVAEKPFSETRLSHFELVANRYLELLKSERGEALRFNTEKPLPTRSIAVPNDRLPKPDRTLVLTALRKLDAYEQAWLQAMQSSYRYDLVTRNCVTELFRSIDAALMTAVNNNNDAVARESEKRLGGHIPPAANMIPFVSYQWVRQSYRVSASRDFDSYRHRELSKLKARQNAWLTSLKESNTLSSRLYTYNPEDALFVFFTDDHLPLRPLFGAVNTVAGAGQSLYGMFSWPFDAGANLKSGATGILMSLPELVFVNMRKGSYRYLSYGQMGDVD